MGKISGTARLTKNLVETGAVKSSRQARKIANQFNDKVADRVADRMVPNTERVMRDAVQEPRKVVTSVAEEGGRTARAWPRYATYTAVGTAAAYTGGKYAVPAYSEMRTEEGVTENQEQRFDLYASCLNDDSLTYEEKMECIQQIKQASERPDPDPGDQGGPLVDFYVPGLGRVTITMMDAVVMLLVLGFIYSRVGGNY